MSRIATLSALTIALVTSACTLTETTDTTLAIVSETSQELIEGGTCEADTMADPKNCGSCGNVCSSGLCFSGTCADGMAGHVFAIGHGYATSNSALDRALGNALYLFERNPVRVLAFKGRGTPPNLVSGTDQAINRIASARGRRWQRTLITNPAEVTTKIDAHDVLLIYAQPNESNDYLNALGGQWSLPLDDFARRGGIVIVLDAASANNGTPQVLAASGLLSLGARSSAGNIAYVGMPEDIAASRIPLTFALTNSVGWDSSNGTSVVSGDAGPAFLIHRAIY